MYAIVDNGGKQYKAEVGSSIKLEKLAGNVGDKVELKVVLVADEKSVKVGKDAEAFKAVGEITEQGKEKKIVVFKYKAKKNERKKQGHRQPYTVVKITEIAGAKAEKAEKAEKTEKAAKPATAKKTTKTAEAK